MVASAAVTWQRSMHLCSQMPHTARFSGIPRKQASPPRRFPLRSSNDREAESKIDGLVNDVKRLKDDVKDLEKKLNDLENLIVTGLEEQKDRLWAEREVWREKLQASEDRSERRINAVRAVSRAENDSQNRTVVVSYCCGVHSAEETSAKKTSTEES